MNALLKALKAVAVGAKHIGKVAAIAAGAGIVTKIASEGIDATPLVILPPLVKLSISVAAPTIAAWLKKSPRQ